MNQLYQFKFRKKYDLVLCIQQCCGIDDKQLRINALKWMKKRP